MEGNLLGFIIIFLVISPFLWAIIMKRNNSTEFHKLWTDNNRGPLVSIVLVKMPDLHDYHDEYHYPSFQCCLGRPGLVVSSIIIAVIYFPSGSKETVADYRETIYGKLSGDGREWDFLKVIQAPLHPWQYPFKELHLADFEYP